MFLEGNPESKGVTTYLSAVPSVAHASDEVGTPAYLVLAPRLPGRQKLNGFRVEVLCSEHF